MSVVKAFVRALTGEPRKPLDDRCGACGKRISLCGEACGFCIACCPGHDDEEKNEPVSWWSR